MQAFMSTITGAVLAAFAGYTLAWYTGYVEGNFALLLMIATAVTGLYWVAEKLWFLPRRRAQAKDAVVEQVRRQQALAEQGFSDPSQMAPEAREHEILAQPWWLDWTAGLFPVILAVFLLRSFLFEPFKIPSGSMIPTLQIGDLILVNKYHYGIRLPVFNTKVWDNNQPERGDVMVFRYPLQPSLDYIKRVIGVPGDEVAYLNKQLTVNGEAVPKLPKADYFQGEAMRYAKQFEESLGDKTYRTLNITGRSAGIPSPSDFGFRENCRYTVEGVVCKVPEGHYFMMGDNRDDSQDSRYWGFVPEENIVGKAFFVWMNFSDFGRIGSFE
ncbi:signal peptidase I [Hydrogenophaga sp. 5NK40-0174]|uniref:signal peptidase I n=1 Tax=Hydrogenophaga sp. 5NK40-0174 TaxID=3127649 RepID=UPI003103C1A9